jgi:hypothetical protein
MVCLLPCWALGLGAGCPDSEPNAGHPAGETNVATDLFAEVAEAVDLNFQHFNGATGAFYFPEIMGSGCALFDYDNDGDLDVYAIQGASWADSAAAEKPANRLFRNNLDQGVLSFTDVTAESGAGDTGYGMGCAVADFDNDGWQDLYVTNFGPNLLLRNNGDGTFRDISAESGTADPRWSCSAAFADFDDDGLLDLYVANYVDYRPEIDRPCYSGVGVRDYCNPNTYRPERDTLYLQKSPGKFVDASGSSGIDLARGNGLGVTCSDFNGDGRTDIYVANDGTPNFLWINEGGGKFRDQALMAGAAVNEDGKPEAGMGVAACDFDFDGDDDIFLTHLLNETNTLYVNNGSGAFRDATISVRLAQDSRPFTGFGTAWFDCDNDGQLDLFVANGAVYLESNATMPEYPYDQRNQLFRQSPGGRFTDVSGAVGPALALSEVSRGAAFGDVDNDGDVDILVSNNNGTLRLLLNRTQAAGKSLTLQLSRTAGSRTVVGSTVKLALSDGRTVWRRVHTCGSYCSASDPRIHIGLGDARPAGPIEIHWRGGGVEKWSDYPETGFVRLAEGTGEPRP